MYLSIYLSIYRSIYLSICLSRYLSIHRAASLSIYLSIDLAPQASIFFSMQKNDGCRSAHGIIFLRRQTVVRWVRKKHNDARDNFGTCCRVRSAARKNTRFIQSGAACARVVRFGEKLRCRKRTPHRWARRNTIDGCLAKYVYASKRSRAMNYRCMQ